MVVWVHHPSKAVEELDKLGGLVTHGILESGWQHKGICFGRGRGGGEGERGRRGREERGRRGRKGGGRKGEERGEGGRGKGAYLVSQDVADLGGPFFAVEDKHCVTEPCGKAVEGSQLGTKAGTCGVKHGQRGMV